MSSNVFFLLLALVLILSDSGCYARRRRAVTNTLGDLLGIKSNPTTKKKQNKVKITPPLRLKPGETAERAPGWQHCIKNIRATLNWKSVKSPGYPDFLESQIQCSWIIEAPIGMKVKLAFRDLDMIGTSGSCAKQFVQIIDIETAKSQGRFCGSSRPGDYVTLGTKLRLDLQADKAVTKVRGFFVSFAAVNEIPGFRSTKSFQSEGKGSLTQPGKINVKDFASNTKKTTPKPSLGSKRSNKKLVYESDRSPRATALSSQSATEAPSSSRVGSDYDYGFGNIPPLSASERNRGNSPVKINPVSQTRNQQSRQRPPVVRQPNGDLVIAASTVPVRIRASHIPKARTAKTYLENTEPVIYGRNNQPHDPNHYTTVHPVRMDMGKFVDHREEKLSTTNLMIIIACGVLFVVILAGVGIFFWYWRKHRSKRRKKRRAIENRKKEERERNDRMEMNVARLIGENQHERTEKMGHPEFLPGQPHSHETREPQPLPSHLMHGHPTEGFERGVRVVSRHGVSFRSEASPPRPEVGEPRTGLNTISRYEQPIRNIHGREFGDRHLESHSQIHRNVSHDSRRYIPRHSPERDHRGFFPGERSPPSPKRYPGNPRYRTTEMKQQPRFSHERSRLQTLDPRHLMSDHHKDHPKANQNEPRSGPAYDHRNSRSNSNQHRRLENRSSNGANQATDVDEDYCSGNSADESFPGKAPMRREYSQWELEQQKKTRKKKLILGR